MNHAPGNEFSCFPGIALPTREDQELSLPFQRLAFSPEAGEEDTGDNEEFPLSEQMSLPAFKGTSLTLSDSQTENKRIQALSTFGLGQL